MFNLDKFQFKSKKTNLAQDRQLLKLADEMHKLYPHKTRTDLLKEIIEMKNK